MIMFSPSTSRLPLRTIVFRQTATFAQRRNTISFRCWPRRPVSMASMSGLAESAAPVISLSDAALGHLSKMRKEKGEDLRLRIGVKQGGCSGMSYTMDFENQTNARPDDSIIDFSGFTIVCDPKSLLFLFGMQLDYSDALIGGGFSFKNPNATQTCGCGKSFAAEM